MARWGGRGPGRYPSHGVWGPHHRSCAGLVHGMLSRAQPISAAPGMLMQGCGKHNTAMCCSSAEGSCSPPCASVRAPCRPPRVLQFSAPSAGMGKLQQAWPGGQQCVLLAAPTMTAAGCSLPVLTRSVPATGRSSSRVQSCVAGRWCCCCCCWEALFVLLQAQQAGVPGNCACAQEI